MKISSIARSRFFQLDLVIIYAIVLTLVLVPSVANNAFVLHLCGLSGIYFIFAAGFNLCAGVAGLVSFGHAGIFSVAAYTSVLLISKAGLPFWAGVILGITGAMLIAIAMGLSALRTKDFGFVLVTMALNWIIYMILWNWVSLTGGQPGVIVKPVTIGKTTLLEQQFLYIIAGGVLFSLIVIRNVRWSRSGRAFDSIRTSEVVAESVGIDVRRYKLEVFLFSAFFAAIAGILYAYFAMFVDPELASVDAGFSLLVIMLIGGWGTQFGPLLGSVVYIFLPAAFSLLQEYSLFIWAIVLLLILRIAPKGLTGLGERLPLTTRPLQTTMQESLTVKAIETTENDKSQPVALEIRNVTKRFGGLIALNNVNLRIAGGQIHGLIGPNGAGKTTLLNVISGFAYPDQGEVNFNGKRIDGLPPHRIAQMGVSRTFQGTILCEGILSIDEVRLGQHTRTKSGIISSAFSTRFARVEEMVSRQSAIDLMHFFEVSDKALVDVEGLPYNCRKFSELARAMASRPMILLLDEPTSGLTMKESESLMEKLRQLRGTGLGILFIDHNVKAVMSVADTITVLNFGSKIAEGTPEAIQNDEGVVTAYLGRKGK